MTEPAVPDTPIEDILKELLEAPEMPGPEDLEGQTITFTTHVDSPCRLIIRLGDDGVLMSVPRSTELHRARSLFESIYGPSSTAGEMWTVAYLNGLMALHCGVSVLIYDPSNDGPVRKHPKSPR